MRSGEPGVSRHTVTGRRDFTDSLTLYTFATACLLRPHCCYRNSASFQKKLQSQKSILVRSTVRLHCLDDFLPYLLNTYFPDAGFCFILFTPLAPRMARLQLKLWNSSRRLWSGGAVRLKSRPSTMTFCRLAARLVQMLLRQVWPPAGCAQQAVPPGAPRSIAARARAALARLERCHLQPAEQHPRSRRRRGLQQRQQRAVGADACAAAAAEG